MAFVNYRALMISVIEAGQTAAGEYIGCSYAAVNQFINENAKRAALYFELGTKTGRQHFQGWIEVEDMDAFERNWKVFKTGRFPKRVGKGGVSWATAKAFRKGEQAMVYSTKDGERSIVVGYTDEELKALENRSFKKGATAKETFWNAIIQRMKEKKVMSKTGVYQELCHYYDENDKELNPWRLMSQTNSICYKMWGEKFSQHLARTEVRVDFNATQEVVPEEADNEAPDDSEAYDSQEDGTPEDDSTECSVCEENRTVGDCSGDEGSGVDGDTVHLQVESDSGLHVVRSAVRQLQDQCSKANVSSLLGQQRSVKSGRANNAKSAKGVHASGPEREPCKHSVVRGSVSGLVEVKDDQKATGTVQHLHQGTRGGDTGCHPRRRTDRFWSPKLPSVDRHKQS